MEDTQPFTQEKETMFYLPCWNWSFYCSLKISPSKQIFKDYIHEKAKPKTKTKKLEIMTWQRY